MVKVSKKWARPRFWWRERGLSGLILSAAAASAEPGIVSSTNSYYSYAARLAEPDSFPPLELSRR